MQIVILKLLRLVVCVLAKCIHLCLLDLSSQERNVVEAAARGAIESTAVIASIAVNLIAFISLMAFLDSGLHYLGAKVGYPELSFQVCLSI